MRTRCYCERMLTRFDEQRIYTLTGRHSVSESVDSSLESLKYLTSGRFRFEYRGGGDAGIFERFRQ